MKTSLCCQVIVLLFFILIAGCKGEEKAAPAPLTSGAGKTLKAEMPYKRIPAGEDDPGDNGPDDTTAMDAIKGETSPVAFSHFSHASNSKDGYGIPCGDCHHETPAGEDPGEGCADCHEPPAAGADPADQGPDDNLILARAGQKMVPVPLTHFNHASTSADGYKIPCDKCHHTGDRVACTDCHEEAEGDIEMPSARRAFHLMCKGCHRDEKKKKAAAKAPIECKDCHAPFKRVPSEDAVSLNRALHLQCIGCHIAVKQADDKAEAPVRACDGCHGAVKKEADGEAEADESAAPDAGVEPAAAVAEAPAAGDADQAELEQNKGPAKLVIDHVMKTKPGVPFPHLAHQELGEPCAKCHHEGLQDPTCRSCHAEQKDAMKRYHKSCRPCHKENGIGTKCGDCHKK
jgi:hypothetical protein